MPEPCTLGERLRHERGVHAGLEGDLPHHEPERHDVVGHREGVGVAEVDLVLARGVLVVAVLDGDAHRLERVDRALAEVGGDVGGGEVEVGRLVERLRRRARVGVGEVEELHLGRGVEAEAPLAGPVEVAAQHLAGVALERRAVDVGDVAEHAGRGAVGVGPREQLEAVRVGPGEHVALLHPAEAVDRRAVEAHALVEGALQLGRGDGEGLELAEHVGEPEPDQPDPSLLDRAQDVVALAFHGGANDGRGAPSDATELAVAFT